MSKLNFSIALGLVSENFKRGLKGAKDSLSGFSSSVKRAVGLIAGAFAAGRIKSFATECVEAYNQQMVAETKLATIMQQRMGASDAEVKSILQLTAAQQQLGVIGDEVQIAGAQQISTFITEKSSLQSLIPAMNNLLAQQKGLNATQGDAVNIGNLMGKAMQGQTSALRRVGITFDEAQEKVLKFGTEEERAAMLAKVIEQNVGKANEALAKTDAGKMAQLNNTLGDLKEKIGASLLPIMAQIAPKIKDFATSASDAIVNAIDTIKANFETFVQGLIALFASIKLTPLFQQWAAEHAAHQEQIVMQAQAAKVRREAIESQLVQKKNALAVLEVRQTEVAGSQKLAIEQKIATQRAAIKELETKLVEAQNAEQTANTAVNAASQTTIWSTAWSGIKAAGVMCWTTIKAAMISTGIGLLIMGVMMVVQKLVTWFVKLGVVQSVWKSITGGIKDAYNWCVNIYDKFTSWLDSLGLIGKAVHALMNPLATIYKWVSKIVGKWKEANAEKNKHEGGTKQTVTVYKANDGQKFSTRSEAIQHNKELAETKALENSSTNTDSGIKDYGGSGGVKTKTKAEKASDDVADALVAYKETVLSLKGQLEVGGISIEDAHKDQLSALRSLYDAYTKAYGMTGDVKYQEQMKRYAREIASLSAMVEGDKEIEQDVINKEKEASEQATKIVEARKKMLADTKSVQGVTMDTTFDYKKTETEKKQALLQFDLENAQEYLKILKEAADSKVPEAIEQVAAAEAKVEGLDKALKLEKVKEDIKQLQKDLKEGKFEVAKSSYQGLRDSVDSVSSMVDKLNDVDASGWEKLCSVLDTVLSLFESIQSVTEAINTVKELSTKLTAAQAAETAIETTSTVANAEAKTAETTATVAKSVATEAEAKSEGELAVAKAAETAVEVVNTEAKTAAVAPIVAESVATEVEAKNQEELTGAKIAETGAEVAGAEATATAQTASIPAAIAAGEAAEASAHGLEQLAAATIFAAHASIPFAGVPLASGFVSTMETTMNGLRMMSFSTGGVVKGSSSVGDFVPALLNSHEMVLNTTQQSRLFNIANGGSSVINNLGGKVKFEIEGRKLVGVLSNENSKTSKIR